MKIIEKGVVIAALAVAVAGCSRDMDDLEQRVAEVKARPGERIEPLPQIKPYESFAYRAQKLRAPFQPTLPADTLASGVRPDAKRPREFLEQFPLDTLRMVGTLKMQGRDFGLVQTKDGLVHRVLPGNYLGQNDGRITQISESEIALVEIVPDGLGGYIERPAGLALAE
ncbi:MAG TPA: pilus assembly protein PilP [Steroidobacteraceae bacterium]|nr:pilus assembly protein PilP [Steroidobacteraceae bacterium]